MKKIFCILLSLTLVLNTVVCTYATDFGGSSGTFETPAPTYIPEPPSKKFTTFLNGLMGFSMFPEEAGALGFSLFGGLSDDDKGDVIENAQNNGDISQDENNYYINANFFKTVNEKIQSNVHALDGYYLIEPQYSYDKKVVLEKIYEYAKSDLSTNSSFSDFYNRNNIMFMHPDSRWSGDHVICFAKTQYYYYCTLSGDINFFDPTTPSTVYTGSDARTCGNFFRVYTLTHTLNDFLNNDIFFSNSPFKIFYTKTDLDNYLNKGRTYAPVFPEINITIPKYYIDNSTTTNLPSIDLSGISFDGSTEADIQAQIDLALKNYIDKLLELSTRPTTTPVPTSTPIPTATPIPTPTTKPSIDTDPTPTPTPGSGNVDLSDTNNLLQKIYNWLVKFGKSHDTLAQTITDYIEKNDGKLDEIITAIDSLSKGDETPEQNGCKYDFTALSEFLTSTWNESDQKFDTMIKLLEENNAYQQQLVDSLNEIKALLVTDTVLDLFKNRSSETANKAKEKFPTSLPWDVAMVVNSMSAEPQEINLTIPVKIESLHIDEEIHIDITGSEWEKLAKTCRYLLSLLFILYLIHLSRKLFFKGDDD